MFYDTFIKLCNEKNIKPTPLLKSLNVSPSISDNWKIGGEPNTKILKELANYFNVTTDYLLGREICPSELIPLSRDEMVTFPVIGTIAAGYNGLAVMEDTGESISVPEYLLKGKKPNDFFVLKVKGNSMYPKFLENDKVLIEKMSSVNSGTIAAVGYNVDEVTLKKVKYVYGEDWLELIPINPDYETKKIEGADLELCRIFGKVSYLFREFN